jgi:dephospho-CoA kinase
VIEAIKLVEGGLAELCDEVWLITCVPAVQLERLVGRGDPPDDARGRIGAQGDIRDRAGGSATRTIDTSGALDEVRRAVDSALLAALERAGRDAPPA